MSKVMNNRKSFNSKDWHGFKRALHFLTNAVKQAEERELTELENAGLIHSFIFVQELARKNMQYYLNEKHINTKGKGFYVKCFELKLIESPELWDEILRLRNLGTHGYDKEDADQIRKSIIEKFHPAFEQLKNRFSELYEQDNE